MRFYAQPGMADNGLSLNQWPVGHRAVHDDASSCATAAT